MEVSEREAPRDAKTESVAELADGQHTVDVRKGAALRDAEAELMGEA